MPGDDDGCYAAADDPPPIAEVLADDDSVLVRTPKMEPPHKDVLIDGRSYFYLSCQDLWGCESVLTTYSNLDNNPAMVGRSSVGGREADGGGGEGGGGAGGESMYPPPPPPM